MQRASLIFDKIQERQDRRKLSGGDHRVLAFETAPERNGTGIARRSVRAGVEPGASGKPDILLAVEERDRIAPLRNGRYLRRTCPPSGFLLGGQHDRRAGRVYRLAESVSDCRLMQRTERRDIGIVTGGDLRGVADRETRHVPFGLQVPKRLVGLAQAGQEKPERTPIVIDDVVSPGPRIDEFLRVANAGSERAGAASSIPNSFVRAS